MKSKSENRLHIEVTGAVQGVGFRPFVYRLARELQLAGWVRNSPAGVEIEIEGDSEDTGEFLDRLRGESPPHALIRKISTAGCPLEGEAPFAILASSRNRHETPGEVLPDLATCEECRHEIFDPRDRRYGYPFTNCTNCGPRYSIVHSLPYDRANTTMCGFEMCGACRAEYEDPEDRRFHAQPNACPDCGPQVTFASARGPDAIAAAAAAIRAGHIVAIKGIGGFHLFADARDPEVIARLRERKARPHKPFAVMFPSLADVQESCEVAPAEAALLSSPAAPIVLLVRRPACDLPTLLAPNNPSLGVLLPYSPLHHLLLAQLGFPVVATSANLGEEPICIDNEEARQRLASIADDFLTHDRPIARAVDDSVVRFMAEHATVLRRSRGFAPSPIVLAASLPPVLALGGDLKNTIALASGPRIFLSQHYGDLASAPSRDAFATHLRDIPHLCRGTPRAVACDLHPGYHSTAMAEGLRLPVLRVQHHHAHLAACLAEHGVDDEVLGIAWDGTGFGTDGTTWGGEFLLASQSGFKRFATLRSFPLPGGDKAVSEPRRAALGLLHEAGIDIEETGLAAAFSPVELRTLSSMMKRKLHAPRTSSAGRLFDAVAALTGLRYRSTFEGQAATDLESQISESLTAGGYPFSTIDAEPLVIDWVPTLHALLADLRSGTPLSTVAARFHHTMIDCMLAVARCAAHKKVALSGGCFQNRFLLEGALSRLRAAGFEPFWPQRIPPNDGGLAFGQAVVAGKTLTS